MTKTQDIYNVDHPSRRKAIEIMETIADKLGKPDIFDCKNGDTLWYNIEDSITEIIAEH